MSFIRKMGLAALFAGLLGSSASAGLVPLSASVISEGDNYRYTYGVTLSSNNFLQTGDSFVIYDFAGFVPLAAIKHPRLWHTGLERRAVRVTQRHGDGLQALEILLQQANARLCFVLLRALLRCKRNLRIRFLADVLDLVQGRHNRARLAKFGVAFIAHSFSPLR